MEMYADEESRGGVLEPEGIVNIKYRRDKQLDTMARLDPAYAELKRALADKSLTAEIQAKIKEHMTEREQLLLPVYNQIALQFADLHDRSGRMQAKDTIRHALQWKDARRFFYWRLRRRLNEEAIIKKLSVTSAREPVSRAICMHTLHAWTGIDKFDSDDKAVALWYEENKKNINAKVDKLKLGGATSETGASDVGMPAY